MRIRPGVILVLALVLAAVFGARYLGWLGGRKEPVAVTSTTPDPTPTTAVTSPAPAPNPGPSGTGVIRPSAVAARTSAPARPVDATTTAVANAAPSSQIITNWEERIDGILTTEGDETAKARELLAMLPNIPEEGQAEAAQHLSNLLPDEEFASLKPLLTNTALSEEVLDVLLTDVLNRPNDLKLPALLDMARTPNHPKGEEARDILEIYVDENFGDNWTAWEGAVQKWLKENPDE